MAKAKAKAQVKKEEEKLVNGMTTEQRREGFVNEYEAITKKYQLTINAQMIYNPQGIVPRVVLVDTYKDENTNPTNQANKAEATEAAAK